MKKPAERIVDYLKANGITQAFVSKRTGINDSTLSAKLKGQVRITVDDIENICLALGRTPADFLMARSPEEKLGA